MAGQAKVTICHATGSATNPYVTITIAESGLNGHSGHANDIIPAPADGCPTTLTTSSGGSDGGTTSGGGASTTDGSTTSTGGTTTTTGGGTITSGRVSLCHATGQEATPYQLLNVTSAQAATHASHPEDIVPAPAGGCPGGTPAPFRCTATTPVLLYASGAHAVTLRACNGTMLRMWGDPWVTYATAATAAAPQLFSVGYGTSSIALADGTVVQWGTDPLSHNAMSWMTVNPRPGLLGAKPVTVQALAPPPPPAAPQPATGTSSFHAPEAGQGPRQPSGTQPAGRPQPPRPTTALVPMTAAQLTELRDALAHCQGETQSPFACAPPPTSTTSTHTFTGRV